MSNTSTHFRKKIIIGLIVIVILGVGWYLGSPLFIDRTVDEAFPSPPTPPTATSPISSDERWSDDARVPAPAASPKPRMMQKSIFGAEVVDRRAPSPAPTDPQPIASGTFSGMDSVHRSSGTATVYQFPDGNRVLRFEQFSVTNGPDLRVLLVPHANPKTTADLTNYRELARLSGNMGNQNYTIPRDLDLSGFHSIAIYCKPFHVLFAAAPLK